jgi:hypothetical protein
MGRIKGPLFGLLAAGLLTWTTYSTALETQGGVHREYTGRRAGLKQLFAWLADLLGPTGVLVAGGLIIAACVAWLVLSLKKGKGEEPAKAS